MLTIHEALSNAHREIIAQQEAYLLEFFGSKENAERFGHLYVFETTEAEMVEVDGKFRLSQTYRLRPKTAEELVAEQARENADRE